MVFNPIRKRQTSEEGGLARVLRTAFDDAAPMGNIAHHDLEAVLYAWLVGFYTEVASVIPRALEWLDTAIQRDEQFGLERNFHRMTLHWSRSLGLWMRDAASATEGWDLTRRFCDEALAHDTNVWSKPHILTYRLDDYMAFSVQAERYEVGLAEFERCHGPKQISPKRTLKPRELGYALCLHKARGQFDAEELFQAGRRMLQANLEQNWLGMGQGLRAATWLKIVYWDRDVREGRASTLTPLQTVLKAYENMPNVPLPEFIGGLVK